MGFSGAMSGQNQYHAHADGIMKPTRGKIELWGQATSRLTVPQKQRIGYVSQHQHFYGWMTGNRLGKFVGGFYPTWDTAEFERLARALDVPLENGSPIYQGDTRQARFGIGLGPSPSIVITR